MLFAVKVLVWVLPSCSVQPRIVAALLSAKANTMGGQRDGGSSYYGPDVGITPRADDEAPEPWKVPMSKDELVRAAPAHLHAASRVSVSCTVIASIDGPHLQMPTHVSQLAGFDTTVDIEVDVTLPLLRDQFNC